MHFQICGNNEGNIIMYLKIVFPSLLQTVLEVSKIDWTHMYKSLVFGDEFLSQGRIYTRGVKLGLGLGFIADQSSSSTLTQSIIFFLNLVLYTETLSC